MSEAEVYEVLNAQERLITRLFGHNAALTGNYSWKSTEEEVVTTVRWNGSVITTRFDNPFRHVIAWPDYELEVSER